MYNFTNMMFKYKSNTYLNAIYINLLNHSFLDSTQKECLKENVKELYMLYIYTYKYIYIITSTHLPIRLCSWNTFKKKNACCCTSSLLHITGNYSYVSSAFVLLHTVHKASTDLKLFLLHTQIWFIFLGIESIRYAKLAFMHGFASRGQTPLHRLQR